MATSDPDAPEPTPALTPTGRAILGIVSRGQTSGYDIKQLVDKATRHFWAASYGQIYPELRRLESQGFIVGHSEPTGGRARIVYEMTDAGREALLAWLESDAEPVFELRDEGMLKLFFSDALPERRIENLRAMRQRHERKLAQLRALEGLPKATGPKLTLQLGIASAQFMIDWCEAAERRLAQDPGKDQ